jgi:serine/threonine protein kinase
MSESTMNTQWPAPSPEDSEILFAGRYKIREKLGEGGMGAVFVADQIEPVQRRVALKLIKGEFATSATLARFEQERQALALMDHPNIAKVFDAGVGQLPPAFGPGSSPYFAMELIKGIPITVYCDDAKLTPKERLDLFIPVCNAVQHAHQKGIIHRDLKPSNILVGLYDGKPMPKIIDFGVAKATGPRLSQQSIYTEIGSLIGTLEYMSPEQADFKNIDIDTRTDIYALGVVLYELLTGTVPFKQSELAAVGIVEMLIMIKEVSPPRPSTKISHSGTLTAVAANRKLEPARLTRLLRGDLDWIVMKALVKEREHRYQTANALAADIDRFLNDQPVLAGPPSLSYRLRKFIRRNRSQVVAAALVLLALIAGIITTTWQAVAATHAKEQALQAAESERHAHGIARKRLDQLEQANAILTSIFRDLDPVEDQHGGMPLRAQLGQRLDQAAALLDGEAVGDPLTVARLQVSLGTTQRRLGEHSKAITLLNKALAIRESHLGSDDPETLQCLHELGISQIYSRQLSAAQKTLERAYQARKSLLGPDHPDTLKSQSELAHVYSSTGQKQGLVLQEQALQAMTRVLGPRDKETIDCMNRLAMACSAAYEDARAEQLFSEVWKLNTAVLGPEHFDTHVAANNLASCYADQGKHAQAVPLFESTLAYFRKRVGPEHPYSLNVASSLATTYQHIGQRAKARQLQEETVATLTAKLGPDHEDTVRAVRQLAINYEMSGEMNRAIEKSADCYRRANVRLGPNHPQTLYSLHTLGRQCRLAGKVDEACNHLQTALVGLKIRFGPDNGDTQACADELSLALIQAQRHAEAAELLTEILQRRTQTAPEDWRTYQAKSRLGEALIGQGKLADAEPLVIGGYQGMKQHQQKIPTEARRCIVEAVDRLILLYTKLGQSEEIKKWQAEKELIKLPEAGKEK